MASEIAIARSYMAVLPLNPLLLKLQMVLRLHLPYVTDQDDDLMLLLEESIEFQSL